MENYCMHAALFPTAELTFPGWNSSLEYSRIVRSCHGLPQKAPQKTCAGGSEFFLSQWQDQFWNPSHTLTFKPIQTQVPQLASAPQLDSSWEHGNSTQDGSLKVETLAGQKQWDFSSWYQHLWEQDAKETKSKSSGTTLELWKSGGLVKAEINRSTTFSSRFIRHANSTKSKYALDTYQANLIQQMAPPEDNTPQLARYSQLLQFQIVW